MIVRSPSWWSVGGARDDIDTSLAGKRYNTDKCLNVKSRRRMITGYIRGKANEMMQWVLLQGQQPKGSDTFKRDHPARYFWFPMS